MKYSFRTASGGVGGEDRLLLDFDAADIDLTIDAFVTFVEHPRVLPGDKRRAQEMISLFQAGRQHLKEIS